MENLKEKFILGFAITVGIIGYIVGMILSVAVTYGFCFLCLMVINYFLALIF
jgi:hypothetical protein